MYLHPWIGLAPYNFSAALDPIQQDAGLKNAEYKQTLNLRLTCSAILSLFRLVVINNNNFVLTWNEKKANLSTLHSMY
jgi:hypothetical protein